MSLLGDLGGAILGVAYEQRLAIVVLSVLGVIGLGILARRRHWVGRLSRHPLRAAGVVIAAAVVGLPLAWYLVSPVFVRTELVEPPVTVAVAATDRPPSVAPTVAPSTAPSAAPTATAAPTRDPDPTPTPWTPAASRRGSFEGTDDFHFGRGTATLAETAPGVWTLRFEDFSVRNGPDLYVYLSPDRDEYARGALEVARLKATDGSFNVALPAGSDPGDHRSVLIWCKQFSHLFAFATLDR